MNTFLMILFITLCVGSASAFIYMRVTHVGLQAFWTKLAASGLFVVGGFVAIMMKTTVSPYMLFILLGLLSCMIGDLFNELKIVYRPHEKQYMTGIIATFALGVVMFLVGLTNAVVASGQSIVVPIFVSLALGAVVATILIVNSNNVGMDFNVHKSAVFAYTFLVSIATAYTISLAVLLPVLWVFAAGMIFFLVSNVIFAFINWGLKESNTVTIVNLSTYYVAQILIMITLFVL
jgi:hypothetical protein